MFWLLLVPAFMAAELVVVHIQARRESVSVSFRELPLVLGLVYLGPAELVVASVLGELLGLLRRRQTAEKLVFNLSLFAFEAALAALLYQLALSGTDPAQLRGLVAAVVAVVVTYLATAVAVTVVIWLKVGQYDEGVLTEAVTTGMAAAVANTSVGLLVVVLLGTRPVAVGLLLVVVGILVLAYRGYSSLSRGHAQLESLYRFTRQVQHEVGTGAVSDAVLRRARDTMAGQVAELVLLLGSTGQRRLRLVDDVVHEPVGALPSWLAPAVDGRIVLLREASETGGPEDALAAPLRVDGAVVGVLAVHGRPHHLGHFSADDQLLFESLANHAAVSLQKSSLVDQLRTEAETQERLSLHDALTGLPNRRLALRALTGELAGVSGTAVLVLDLDGFTAVNEAFGYTTGDQLLREVGRRLSTRATAPGHVARLGNDEFAVVLPAVGSTAQAVAAADHVLDTVREAFTFHALAIDVRVNAGLAVAPGHGTDAELLLQRADAALYAAKRDRAELRLWDPVSQGDGARRLALLRHLRETIEAGGLDVHYQPKIIPGTGEPVGAEALVRWAHPEHGQVSPDDFIPLAEQSGLIHPLTAQVLAAALTQCAAWRRDLPELTVAVNLSARSLLEPGLPEQVRSALATAGLPAAALTLELTETAVMTDLDRALEVLGELAALGVRLSIDDFGTGQSSLAYLKVLPVHELKVDRTFVRDAATDAGDAAIVRAAVSLGHTHGLVVVAEGVEDDPTRVLLDGWGCDVVQGFHISRPLPAEVFVAWLAGRSSALR